MRLRRRARSTRSTRRRESTTSARSASDFPSSSSLGLPILKQLCESTDGAVSLTSQKGVGTELRYSFSATHIDLPPMGDLAETILMLFNYPGDFDLTFT